MSSMRPVENPEYGMADVKIPTKMPWGMIGGGKPWEIGSSAVLPMAGYDVCMVFLHGERVLWPLRILDIR